MVCDRMSLVLLYVAYSCEVVLKHLSKAYDVNYGARSLAYEVEYVVLRLVAEAQMAGDISNGYVGLSINLPSSD